MFRVRCDGVIALSLLAEAAGGVVDGEGDVDIARLCLDSRRASPGELFVAIGEGPAAVQHVHEAVARGAVAACVSREAATHLRNASVALLVVEDPRAVLGKMSAAFHGNPARAMQLIGVTGTLGKTSTAALIQAAYPAASGGRGIGVVGSLGASVAGGGEGNHLPQLGGMTTPDAPELHAALRAMRDEGVRLVAMEVTSHALAQGRVEGLSYSLGVITNLVPDEHLEFHGTAGNYLRTKARFLDYLEPAAPLVVNADDPLVLDMASRRRSPSGALVGVTLDDAGVPRCSMRVRCDALATVRDVRWDVSGSRFTLHVPESLPLMQGGTLPGTEIPIALPLLGIQHATNAAIASITALVAGASGAEVAEGLARAEPVRRRMQILRAADPCVIDDTTGNPEALQAVFTTIRAIPRSALRIVFGLRGSRGTEINARLAKSLAALVLERAAAEPVTLVVTGCDDVSPSRERVTDEERDAALQVLRPALDSVGLHTSLVYMFEPALTQAIERALRGVRREDLVLLLGTQAMDGAAGLTDALLRSSGAPGRKPG
ncbi:UDP-N-acetylmuramoyl-L-alanyl-D-glutamate--2,6-diaminopimelate ligase [soil metagenome]